MPNQSLISPKQPMRGVAHVDGGLPRSRGQAARSVHILVSRPELARCVERVARVWDASLQVAPPGELRQRVEAALALPQTSLLVVGLSADLGDELLLDMLTSVQRFLGGEEPWEAIPEFALLTGRDIEQVTGLSQRLLRSAPVRVPATRFVHIQSSAQSAETFSWERYPLGEGVERAVLEAAGLAEFIRRPAAAVAFQTHGGEAC